MAREGRFLVVKGKPEPVAWLDERIGDVLWRMAPPGVVHVVSSEEGGMPRLVAGVLSAEAYFEYLDLLRGMGVPEALEVTQNFRFEDGSEEPGG